MAWMGAIGFLDDYLKLKQKRDGKKNTGLVERYKLVGQITLGFALGFYLWKHPLSQSSRRVDDAAVLQVHAHRPLTAGLGWLYVLFVTFVLTGTSNAVNSPTGSTVWRPGSCAIAFADLRVLRLPRRPLRREPVPARLLPARRPGS